MANKRDADVDMDDIGFDDFGDFGEGGFDGESPKPGSRKPVTSLKGSFVSGVKEGLMDRSNQINYVKSSMPKSYQSALEIADTAAGNVRELYDTAAKEAQPIVKNLKKVTRSAMPGLKDKLPKGLAAKLEAWADEADRGGDTIDPEESEIALSLGTIFNAHQEQQQKAQEEMEERQQARDIVASKQSDSQLTALQKIVNSSTRLVSYQDQITAQYQRKSLELQYRHYFTARKTLDVLQKQLEITQVSMESLVKNTALPDILKEHNTEKAAEIMKRKWLGNVTEPASQWFGQMGRRVMTKSKNDIVSFTRDFSMTMQGLIDGAEMASDQAEQEASMTGESQSDVARRMAGQAMGGAAATAFYGKVNQMLEFIGLPSLRSVMADSKFGSAAGAVGDVVKNRETYIRTWLEEASEKGGTAGRIADYIFEGAGRPGGVNTLVSKSSSQEMQDERQYWTLQNSRTLNEIIPGWLSKIHYEIKSGNAMTLESTPFEGMRDKVKQAAAAVEAEHFHTGTGRFERVSKIDELTKEELEDKSVKENRGRKLDAVMRAFYPYEDYSDTDEDRLPRAVIKWVQRYFIKMAEGGATDARKLLNLMAAPEESESDVYKVMFGGKNVPPKWSESVRRYVRTHFKYNKKTEWDIDGLPKGNYLRVFLISGGQRIGKLVAAFRDYAQADKGIDLGRVLDIEGRGTAYSESLERLGVTKREGDKWKPDRHLVQKELHGRIKEDMGSAAIAAGERLMGSRYEVSDDQRQAELDAETTQGLESRARIAERRVGDSIALRGVGRNRGTRPPNPNATGSVIGFNPTRANGGYMFNAGGQVPGVGMETGDQIDAKVSQGEYVVRKESTKMPGVLPLLRYLNSLGAKPGHAPTANVGFGEYFAAGGSPGGAGGSEIANLHVMVEEKLKYSNEVLSDMLTVLANIRTKPFISISAGKLADFPDLKLNDLSGAEELLVGGKRKLMAGLNWSGGKAKALATWSYNAVGGVVSKAFGMGSSGAGSLKEWWSKQSDIFVNGERKAALDARMLAAGEYFDVKTGQVIKSLKDIKGEVKDRYGKTVISIEDFAKGFHDSRLKPALEWLKDRGKDAYALGKKPFEWAGKAGEFVYDVLDMPDDIYVLGSDPWVPRLYARVFREGGYFNAEDGTVIKRVGQITGAIKGRDGNSVIEVEDLPKLVDFERNPIRGLSKRLTDRAKEGLAGLFKLPGKAIDMAWMGAMYAGDKLSQGWGWLKNFFSGNASISVGLFSGQATTVNRLEQIWMLLNARLPGRRHKQPADFGKMSSIKLPDMSKHVEGAQNFFGKQFTAGLMRWEKTKALSAAKMESVKLGAFEALGNYNAERNAAKRRGEEFVGPQAQSRVQKLSSSVSERIGEILGEKGTKRFWQEWYERKSKDLEDTDIMKRLQALPKIDRRKLPADIKARYNDLVKRFQETESVHDLTELVRFRESVAARYESATAFAAGSLTDLKNTITNIPAEIKKAQAMLKRGGPKRKALLEYINSPAASHSMKEFHAGRDAIVNWQRMLPEERKMFDDYSDSVEGKAYKGAQRLIEATKSANSKIVGKVKEKTGDLLPDSLESAKGRAGQWLGNVKSGATQAFEKLMGRGDDARYEEYLKRTQLFNASRNDEQSAEKYSEKYQKLGQRRLSLIAELGKFEGKTGLYAESRRSMIQKQIAKLGRQQEFQLTGWKGWLKQKEAALTNALPTAEKARNLGTDIRGGITAKRDSMRDFFTGSRLITAMSNRKAARSDQARLKELQAKDVLTLEETEERDALQRKLGASKRTSLWNRITRKKISHDLDGDGHREGSAEEQLQDREKAEERGWMKRMAMGAGGSLKAGWDAGKGKGGVGMLSAMAGAIPKLFSGIAGGLGKVVTVARGLLGMKVGGKLLAAGATIGRAAMTIGRAAVGTTGMLLRGGMMAASYGTAILTSPVGLAVGAALIAGYGAYRGMKYLFRENEPIARFRMQQYGIDPDKEEEVQKVMQLERMVFKITQCSQGQQAKFGEGMTADEAMAVFGIDTSNKEEVDRWVGWFVTRFKPVYLSHMTVLVNLTGKKALQFADKLMDSKTKLEYLPAVHFGGDRTPYDFAGSPFAGEDENHYDKDDICGYFGYYNDAVEWVKDHAEETDEEFAAQGDPKKRAALEAKKSHWKEKTTAAWDTLTSGTLLSDAKNYWVDKVTNNAVFQAGAQSLHDRMGEAGNIASGAVALVNRVAAAPGNAWSMVNNSLNTGTKAGLWKPNKPAGLEQHIINTAAKYGIDPTYMMTMAMIESGGDPTNYPGKGSKKPGEDKGPGSVAYGIYQFVPGTGKDYGLYPNGKDMRGDWMMNVDAGGQLARANAGLLRNGDNVRPGLGRAPEPWELYMAHQQGHAGFLDLVRLSKEGGDPSKIRYRNGKGYRTLRQNMDSNGGKGKSPAEFLADWKNRYYRKVAAFSGGMSSVPTVAVAADKAAETQLKKYDEAKAKADSVDKTAPAAVKSATATAAANTGSTKPAVTATPAKEDEGMFGGSADAAPEVVKAAVAPQPIVPAVAANTAPAADEGMFGGGVEAITVAAQPVAEAPKLTEASIRPSSDNAANAVDDYMAADREAQQAAAIAAERAQLEVIHNTSDGIDGAVRLLREQLKVNINMDRSLSSISETLKRMERQQKSGGGGAADKAESKPTPALPRPGTVAESQQAPVSMSKRA